MRIQLSNVLQQIGFPSTTAGSIAIWDPFDQNTSADWFDSEYMFGVTKGFDVVIGNPPYVVNSDKQLREIYKESARGRPNLYGYFIHCSLQNLLADNGTLIFINPRTLLTDAYFSRLRSFILKNSRIRSIVNITNRRNVFEDVLQSCIINCFRKTEENSSIKIRNVSTKEDISSGKWVEIQRDDFLLNQKDSTLYIVAGSGIIYEIFRKLKKLNTFREHGISFITGKVQWDIFRTFLGPTPGQQATRLIWAENVQRYFFAEAKRRRDRVYMNGVVTKLMPITHDTIIVQRTTAIEQNYRIIAHIFSPEQFEFPIHAENDTSYMLNLVSVDLRFVLGLLNSKFIDFIFRHINSNTHVSAGELNSLPFPEIGESGQEAIIALVDCVLEAKRADASADTSKQEAEIDCLVYTLYGLDEHEIAVVENGLRS